MGERLRVQEKHTVHAAFKPPLPAEGICPWFQRGLKLEPRGPARERSRVGMTPATDGRLGLGAVTSSGLPYTVRPSLLKPMEGGGAM